jgi:hypothetical protein
MSRSFFIVLAALLACLAVVCAQNPVPTNCNLLSVTLFQNDNGVPGEQINEFAASYTTIVYNVSLGSVFITPTIFAQVVLAPESGANYTFQLPNGNVTGPFLWPAEEAPVLVGPFLTGCNVSNELTIITSQFSDVDFRDANCTYIYIINIRSASTCCTGVCGDPQFKGLRGQSFQIHGIDGAVYNLISAKDYSLNSEFVFLTGPRACPIIPSTGRRSVACWTHDGSYLKNLAVRTANGETIVIESGDATTGFVSVVVNDKAITIGQSVEFSKGSISFNTTHEVSLQLGQFSIEVENNNGFLNLRSVHVPASQWASLAEDGGVHGLLGQTWRSKHYSGKVKEIEGEVDDYAVFGGLFDTDFVYNRMV